MRKIWKRVPAVLAAGVLMLACAACSGGNENADVTLDVGALADRLASELTFQDQLTALEGDAGLNIYGLDSSTAAQHKVYVSTGATAEEIAVFEAVSTEAAASIEEAVNQRVADQKAAFEDYQPKEMTKLNDPLVDVMGKYVILCLSDDNSAAQAIIDEAAGR